VPAGYSEADTIAAWFGTQAERLPTTHVEMGPFYRKRAPAVAALRAPGDPGTPLSVTGKVITVHGDPVPGARIEAEKVQELLDEWRSGPGGRRAWSLHAVREARTR
jgi:hypothetical protein